MIYASHNFVTPKQYLELLNTIKESKGEEEEEL
jgi:hypothetical protein